MRRLCLVAFFGFYILVVCAITDKEAYLRDLERRVEYQVEKVAEKVGRKTAEEEAEQKVTLPITDGYEDVYEEKKIEKRHILNLGYGAERNSHIWDEGAGDRVGSASNYGWTSVPRVQSIHTLKTVTLEQRVPTPEEVVRKVPVEVVKHVPYEVKVSVPTPYTVEKKVPYPVKVFVNVPVQVPQPYHVTNSFPNSGTSSC